MNKYSKIIAAIIIGQWVISLTCILIVILLDLVSLDEGIDLLKSYSSITSGFVGIIVGYFFSIRQ